jgi:hypothetical protein
MKTPMICMVQTLVPSVKGGMPLIKSLAFKFVLCCVIRDPFDTRYAVSPQILDNKKPAVMRVREGRRARMRSKLRL